MGITYGGKRPTVYVPFLSDYLHEKGIRLWDNWIGLSTEEPPEDALGKIGYGIRLITQMGLSKLTESAGMAAFLLEEAVQAIGMGAFLLYQSRDFETLDTYLDNYNNVLSGAEAGIIGLAAINPLLGGTVMVYLDAARKGYEGLRKAVDFKLLEIEKKAKDVAEMIDEKTGYGTFRLQSAPSNAEIWINNENTELLTPETFKKFPVGDHIVEVRHFDQKAETWDSYTFEITMDPGRKKEIYIRIPEGITSEEETPGQTDETDTAELPPMIKAVVTGEYAIDGDTFITDTGERIRVLAIDAPEIGRPWSEESKEALAIQVEDKKISLRIQSHKPLDTHGRTLALCRSWKGDVAIFQLSSGLARVLYFDDDIFDYVKYYAAEQVAKDRGIGIWS